MHRLKMDHAPKIIEIRQKVKCVRRRPIHITNDSVAPYTSREGNAISGDNSFDNELNSDIRNGQFLVLKQVSYQIPKLQLQPLVPKAF